jgi:hypothetical protein
VDDAPRSEEHGAVLERALLEDRLLGLAARSAEVVRLVVRRDGGGGWRAAVAGQLLSLLEALLFEFRSRLVDVCEASQHDHVSVFVRRREAFEHHVHDVALVLRVLHGQRVRVAGHARVLLRLANLQTLALVIFQIPLLATTKLR